MLGEQHQVVSYSNRCRLKPFPRICILDAFDFAVGMMMVNNFSDDGGQRDHQWRFCYRICLRFSGPLAMLDGKFARYGDSNGQRFVGDN